MCSGNGYEEAEPTHAYIKHSLYANTALPSTKILRYKGRGKDLAKVNV